MEASGTGGTVRSECSGRGRPWLTAFRVRRCDPNGADISPRGDIGAGVGCGSMRAANRVQRLERMWVPEGDGRSWRRDGCGSKRGTGGVGVGADMGARGGRAEFVFPGSISLLGNRKRRGTGI